MNHMVLDENPNVTELADQGMESLKKYTLKVRALSRSDWDSAFREVRPVTNQETYELFLRFERGQRL